MKSIRNPFSASTRNLCLTGSIVLSFASSALAETFIYDNTTSGTTQWTAGTNWSAIPVSAANTTLTFGNGAALAASDVIVSNNDNGGDFKLNILNMTYAGPASGAAPAVNITGGRLEAISDISTPTMVFNTTGTVQPVVTLGNNLLLTNDLGISATTNATFGGSISGPGRLTKAGAGVVTLTGLASYAGNTTISAGVLDVGNLESNSLGIGGLLLTGGVLQGHGTFIRNFNSGGLVAAANGELAGGSGGFSARGGPLTVNFGGASASVSLSGPNNRLGNGFILNSSSANNKVTVVNPLALNGAARVFSVNTGTGGDSAELSGVLSGASPSGVNKTGAGVLLLSNSNTYAGVTTVTAGTLAISSANALGAAALGATNNTTTVADGARLQLVNNVSTDPNEPLAIAGTGGGIPAGSLHAGTGGGTWSGPITLNGAARIGATAGNTLTVTGSIGNGLGTGVSISGLSGTGVVILNPALPNTYTGQTNLVRGTLRLGKTDALPVTTTLDAKDAANAVDPTGLDLAGFNQTITGLFDSGANANTVISNSAATTTSILTINNTAARIYDGFIADGAGAVALVKGGTSTQTLNGANSYSGETTVNVGGLAIGNDTALGTNTGATTIISTGTTTTGGRLILSNNITSAENLVLKGNSEQSGGFNATVESISGNNTLTGTITLFETGGQRINSTGAGSLTLAGPIARTGSDSGALVLRTGTIDSTINVENTISLNGNGLNVQGLGTVVMKVASTDFLSANISFGGPALTLRLGVENALPPVADLVIGTANTTTGNDQGILDLAGFNQTVRSLNGVASAGIAPSAAIQRKITNSDDSVSTLTVGNTSVVGNFTNFDGVIEDGTGGVAVTKVGEGTIILAGDNTYTGATLINSGALRVNGSLAAGSTVTVGANGTLGGTGTVNGVINASGTIAPGSAAPGILTTTGTSTLSGTLAVEIDGANSDRLASTGSLTISGPLTVTLLAGGFNQPSYVIAQGAPLSGTFSSVPEGYAVTYSGTQATLTQAGTSADYTAWATGFGLQNPWLGTDPALDGTPAADPDGDGMTNRQEYAFGLIPDSGSSVNPITVQLDKTDGDFSYTRRATPLTTGLTYIVKTSTDLVNWTDFTSTSSQTLIGTINEVETIEVVLPEALLAEPTLFVRMQAQ